MTDFRSRPFLSLVKSPLAPAVPRINVTELYSVREWSNRYGCTPEALRAAVAAVGNIAADVEIHLRPGRDVAHDQAALRAAFHDQPPVAGEPHAHDEVAEADWAALPLGNAQDD